MPDRRARECSKGFERHIPLRASTAWNSSAGSSDRTWRTFWHAPAFSAFPPIGRLFRSPCSKPWRRRPPLWRRTWARSRASWTTEWREGWYLRTILTLSPRPSPGYSSVRRQGLVSRERPEAGFSQASASQGMFRRSSISTWLCGRIPRAAAAQLTLYSRGRAKTPRWRLLLRRNRGSPPGVGVPAGTQILQPAWPWLRPRECSWAPCRRDPQGWVVPSDEVRLA